MNRMRIGASILALGLVATSCGGNSTSTPRKRNAALAVNTPMRTCVLAANAQCGGAVLIDKSKVTSSRNLAGADLSGMTFSNMIFDGYSLEKANLSNTRITDLSVANVRSSNASFVNASIRGMSTMVPLGEKEMMRTKQPVTANFSGANFSFARIRESDLFGADLTNAVFHNAILADVNLSFANLTGVDLSHTDLEGIRASNVIGQPLLPQGWALVNGSLVGPGALVSLASNATSIDSMEETLVMVRPGNSPIVPPSTESSSCPRFWQSGANFKKITPGVAMGSGKFGKVVLSDIDFSGVDLRGVDFSNMELSRINFSGANLASANFTNAKLESVNFSFTNLLGAKFTRTQMNSIQSGCTTGNPSTLPSGWSLFLRDFGTTVVLSGKSVADVFIRRGFLLGPGSDLRDRNVAGLDLRNIDTTKVQFDGATNTHAGEYPLSGKGTAITVSNTQSFATGWGVRNGILVGPSADLSYGSLNNAKLDAIDLSSADLDHFSSSQLSGTFTVSEKYRIAEGRIVGPAVNLDNVVFGKVDLTGVSLMGASLVKTDLSKATLDNVVSGGIVGEPRLPAGWKSFGGYILGPTANLEAVEVDLAGDKGVTNLDGFDLSRANLSRSSIRGFVGKPMLSPGWFVAPVFIAGSGVTAPNVLLGPESVLSEIHSKFLPKDYVLPVGYVLTSSGLVGPQMELKGEVDGRVSSKGANYSGDIANLDLSGSTLRNVSFADARLTNARGVNVSSAGTQFPKKVWPSGWDVRNKILVGPSANLENVDLSDIDLSNIDLSQANMKNARGVRLKFNAQTRLPAGWAIANGTLVGPQANLSDLYLSDVNLDGVDLSGADLAGFIGKRITGAPVLPERYGIVRGYLIGEAVDAICSDVLPDELSGTNLLTPSRANALLDPQMFASKQNQPPCL